MHSISVMSFALLPHPPIGFSLSSPLLDPQTVFSISLEDDSFFFFF